MKQQTPFFITITSEVLRDKDLNPIEKLIFTEIMAQLETEWEKKENNF
jgi:hypothetical protein